MSPRLSSVARRAFLTRTVLTTTAGAAAMAAAPATAAAIGRAAIGPIVRRGSTRMRVGLAAYSMRTFLQAKPGSPASTSGRAMDLLGFIDWAATLDTDAVELTSYYFPETVTPAYLNEIKRRCHLNGLDISGGAIRNNFTLPPGPELESWFTHLDTWLNHYAAIGAPVIRVFAGIPPKGVSEEEGIRNAITNLKRACEMAATRGVILGLENHDYLTNIDRMLPIVRAVDSPWFGVNLDSGNVEADDPYAELAKIAPYAVNVQVKVEVGPASRPRPTDLARVVDLLAKVNFRGYVVLEYEAKPDPYEAVPRHLRELRTAITARS
jgi:sugar phosphate isomerase/epimerase